MSLNEVANFVSLRPIYVFRQSLVVSERSLFPASAFSIFYCSVKIIFFFSAKAQNIQKKILTVPCHFKKKYNVK